MPNTFEIHADADGRIVMTLPIPGRAPIQWALTDRQSLALLMQLHDAMAQRQMAQGASMLDQIPMLDVVSPSFQIGSDDAGRAMLAIEVAPFRPMHFRFTENEARQIIAGFVETVETPETVRKSNEKH